jgi:hypothetical protein
LAESIEPENKTIRIPCPRCGATDTIEGLQDQLKELRNKAYRATQQNNHLSSGGQFFSSGLIMMRGTTIASNLSPIYPDYNNELRFVHEGCAECGVMYVPGYQDLVKNIREKMTEIEKQIPLDLLADTIEEPSAGPA